MVVHNAFTLHLNAALTESLGSMGPNQIVLGVDRDRDLLIVHQLVPDDERADPLGLG